MTISVPFKVDYAMEGLAEIQGLIGLEPEAVIVEFQTKDALLGVWKSGMKTATIPLGDIAEVDFRKSIFGNSLIFRFTRLRAVSELPNQAAGEAKFTIERKHLDRALSFVSHVKLEVAEQQLRAAEAEADQTYTTH